MKMKIPVLDKEGKKISDVNFDVVGVVRDDIFKKAYLAESSLFFQPKGADPMAGKRQVINLSKRRKAFRSTYGRSGSRTPKKVMWARGTQHRFVGAWASQTVGGRRAHPPKAEKITLKNINNKEWLLALRSGVLASFNSKFVESNGQRIPKSYPFILDDSAESISKTKDAVSLFEKLGFSEELGRVSNVKIRAGKGTMRNRRYRVKRGPLLVVSSFDAPLLKSSRNIKGFEVMTPELLMASDFGMSEKPGRAVVFTKSAFEQFKEVLA